ncbi:hypothetical protein K2173_024144 [Erythroxylum novogranatense]|uniref:Protein kinase domain-containing protein n=1 Tax=Erythroxylum novogranatense TaxID=1862640 RepID=A0AAV8UC15_9ROSI|nr:hypothetical protein K2173_024144 [Erythroxylum novogranatense]
MEKQSFFWCCTVLVFLAVLVTQTWGLTDPDDVVALQDLYRALNNPPQLNGWRLGGVDPCLESWTGVLCSGSSVTHIKLHELNISGYLGTQLHYLRNLRQLDMSSNYILGEIPYGLPPNATHINLACNNLSRNIPHSLPSIKFLQRLNLSHNHLSGPVGNVFTGLQNLKEMDLSYNNFDGDLPSSFGSLTNLTGLFLHNNQFTGSVVYLANLPLTDLNIQNNHFSGVVPTQFQAITNLWIAGNKFHRVANYPPWNFPPEKEPTVKNYSGPPTTEVTAIEDYSSLKRHKKKGFAPGGVACIVGVATLITTFCAIYFAFHVKKFLFFRLRRARGCSPRASEASPHLLPLKSQPILGESNVASGGPIRTDKVPARRSFVNNYKAPVCATTYTVAELQLATNSFSEENLLGEGSLGSVYKAEFPDGKILAVKNINTVSLSFYEEEQFLDVIWTLSRLRHPNIIPLKGYCVEHGEHLLVYEYIKNLPLDAVLHGKGHKPLSWISRLNIALGVATGLDYLHSRFSPPVAHGNIKAANILLDKEFIPCLCDCGLWILKPLTSNSVKVKASEIAISNSGYVAPDHGNPGADNTKADIYAFGVLLLELLTGRRPFDKSRPQEEQSLVKWASSRLHDNESLAEMVDPEIKRTLSIKALSRFADVVSLCVQPEKIFRPPMSEIVESLTYLLQLFTTAKGKRVDRSEIEPLERSFCSTHTRFIGSPTLSHASY